MRVAFDATTLRPGQTGIGYYTEHLLHHLVKEFSDSRWLLVSNNAVETSLPLPGGVETHVAGRFLPRTLWIQAAAPILLRSLCPDVAHFTNSISPLIRVAPTVITIHDMTLSLFPKLHPLRRMLTRPLVYLGAKQADAVITVSKTSSRDIVRLTGVPESRIHVIYEAAAPSFRPINESYLLEQTRTAYHLSDRIILHVGTIEPRKNLLRLIKAFAQVHQTDFFPYQLVCAGPFGWGYGEACRLVEELDLKDDVRLLGYVPFRDLPGLYNLSEFVVFPSLYEGFGLPVLEAMACGTPVITSRNSSLEEIAKGAVETVDPRRTDSIASALRRLAIDEDRREELTLRGLRHSQRFSWLDAAQKTMEVYSHVIG